MIKGKLPQAVVAARAAYHKAWAAYAAILVEHKEEIEALHKLECPDCPRDGGTIFPEAK